MIITFRKKKLLLDMEVSTISPNDMFHSGQKKIKMTCFTRPYTSM